MKLLFSAEKNNNIGLYNDLCIKTVTDMEDNVLLILINFIYEINVS